jgi:excisionase family DNA binding protein
MFTPTSPGKPLSSFPNILNSMTKDLLTLTETCRQLGITRKTVVALIEGGSLRAVDVSPRPSRRLWRVRADSVAAFIATRSVGGSL